MIRRAMGSHAWFYAFGDDLSRLEKWGQSQGLAKVPVRGDRRWAPVPPAPHRTGSARGDRGLGVQRSLANPSKAKHGGPWCLSNSAPGPVQTHVTVHGDSARSHTPVFITVPLPAATRGVRRVDRGEGVHPYHGLFLSRDPLPEGKQQKRPGFSFLKHLRRAKSQKAEGRPTAAGESGGRGETPCLKCELPVWGARKVLEADGGEGCLTP